MGKYNFEKGHGEFDETIKLDSLNKEVREKRHTSNRNGNHKRKKRRRRRRGGGGIFIPAIILGIAAAAVIFVVMFMLMGGNLSSIGKRNNGNTPSSELSKDQVAGKEGFYALINSKSSDGKVGFYDFEHDVIYNMSIGSDTVVTDNMGSKLKNSVVEVGDIVKAYIDFDSKKVISVNYTDDVWTKDNILGSAISVDSSTVTVGGTVYNYYSGTLVAFENSVVNIKDISDSDVLCIKGYGNDVWSIKIKESVGYITVIGWEEIENGVLSVDGGSSVKIDKEKIEIAGGKHTIDIKGDNIEDYNADVYITPGSEVSVSLDYKATTGQLKFNCNATDYDLYINGSLYKDKGECILPFGVYTLSVVKDGYNTWFKEVTLDSELLQVDITLEKNVTEGKLTIYSQPTSAEVYIDEEYIGRAPVMVKRAYGDYAIRVSLDGYPDVIDVVSVKGADVSYTAKLELEDGEKE